MMDLQLWFLGTGGGGGGSITMSVAMRGFGPQVLWNAAGAAGAHDAGVAWRSTKMDGQPLLKRQYVGS